MTRILPTFAGISLLIFSAGLIASDLSTCVDIDDPVQRLACYDRLSGRVVGPEAEQTEPEFLKAESAVPEPAVPATTPKRSDVASGNAPTPTDPAGFGLKRDQRQGAEPDHITAMIVSVQTSPTGAQILSLSNGQIWTEIEKGRRPIDPQQEVTIRRYRWHYEMELKAQPDITVKRLQ